MKTWPTSIPDVLLIEPSIHGDKRGFFFESFNARDFADAVGLSPNFVQDSHSHSKKNVLRGLHYQIRQPQGKLVRVSAGEIFDVAVDLRETSPTFGKWTAARLSAANHHQLWIPPGFAHGFLVLSESADVLYKLTDFWAPEHERCIVWNDPELDIAWPLDGEPQIAGKDLSGKTFRNAATFAT